MKARQATRRLVAMTAALVSLMALGEPDSRDPAHLLAEGALTSRAEEGPVRLIVGLRVQFEPEGVLAPSDAAAQRQAVEQVARGLSGRLMARGAPAVQDLLPLPFVVVEADLDTVYALLSDPEVATIEEDVLFAPLLGDSVPLIAADHASFAAGDGQGTAVAILDTGVSGSHPDLAGRVVSEACYSVNDQLSGATSLCPGGVTESTAAGSGEACHVSLSECTHGTGVAAVAAGARGVAPAAGVISIQVFTRFDSMDRCSPSPSPCVRAWNSSIIRGLNRVVELSSELDVAAVNMSLGSGRYEGTCDTFSPAMLSAIDNLRSIGIPTVVASGNGGYTDGIAAPACKSSAISVGSTDKTDRVSSFSSTASHLDLLAPGHEIETATVGGGRAPQSGTSFAAPHVAGAFALLRVAAPHTPVSVSLAALADTGARITDHRSVSSPMSFPRVRLDAALAQLGARPSAEPSITPPSGTYYESMFVTMSAEPGASVRFTLDGSEPWLHSAAYDAPMSLAEESSVHLRARAFRDGRLPSPVAEETIRVTGTVATPELGAPGGMDYTSELRLTVSVSTPRATIRYTTDGSTPGAASPTYEAPLVISPGETLNLCARAFRPEWRASEPACAAYRVLAPMAPPSLEPRPGHHDEPVHVTIVAQAPGATIRYTLDGDHPGPLAQVYTGPIALPWNRTTVIRVVASAEGFMDSEVLSATYHLFHLAPDPGAEQDSADDPEISTPRRGCSRSTSAGDGAGAGSVLLLLVIGWRLFWPRAMSPLTSSVSMPNE